MNQSDDLDANTYGALILKANSNIVRVEIEQRRVERNVWVLSLTTNDGSTNDWFLLLIPNIHYRY